MKIIFEFKPERKTWVIYPALILFANGAEGNYTDWTLAWLCFSVTLRLGEANANNAQ